MPEARADAIHNYDNCIGVTASKSNFHINLIRVKAAAIGMNIV